MSERGDGRKEAEGEGPSSEPGAILAGKYRVERLLGSGGMGKVVSAVHIDLMELRAIKFMHAHHLGDADAVGRFLREARAISRLKSEHTVKVHDVGRLSNGAPYMVMEHLEGVDLGAELARRQRLPVAEAVLHVLQACEALAEAHAAGIVHRDLKPENLFLATDRGMGRSIKILDFGISKVTTDPNELRMTKTTTIMGSPLYMSPEQTQASRDVDARGDIWSLGVVLYQLVTGEVPFDGHNITEILSAVLFKECPLPSALVPSLPRSLDRIILRCLEKDPARRYASIAELAEDLAPLAPAAASRSTQRIARMSLHIEDATTNGAVSSDPIVPPPARGHRWMFALGVTLSVALFSFALLLGRSWYRRALPRPAPSPASVASPVPEPSAPSTAGAAAPARTAAPPAPTASVEVVPAPPPVVSARAPIKAHPRPSASASASSPPPSPEDPPSDPFGTGRR